MAQLNYVPEPPLCPCAPLTTLPVAAAIVM